MLLLGLSVAVVLIPLLRRTTPRTARHHAEGTASASDPANAAVVSGGEPR